MFLKQFSFCLLLLCLARAATAQIQLSGLNVSQSPSKEPVSLAIARENPGRTDSLFLSLSFKMDKNVHIYSSESLFFKIAVAKKEGLGTETIMLPKPESFTNFDKTAVSVFVNGQKACITAPITAPDWSLAGSMQSQACDSRMCFTPRTISFRATSKGELSAGPEPQDAAIVPSGSQTSPQDVMDQLYQFTIVGSAAGYLNAAKFSDFLKNPLGSNRNKNGPFENKGLLLVILLILVGGIALNLTPCVLPMMPVTVAIIGAGAQARSPGRGMLVGTVYGLAMALTYGGLGMLVVLTGAQFGAINASPVFNIAIAIVFLVMSLAMFDIIQVDFTRFRKSGAPRGERGRLLTVFVMGIIASLLAGACVAPVVISVILYAGTLYSGGNYAGLFLPFLLGAGMALPWPFAGAGLSFLPKPGKWMVWIKYAFGVFILGMAFYYGYLGITLVRERSAVAAALSAEAGKNHASDLPWTASLDGALQRSHAERKPVFIDFWATWCKNCKAMDATTFRDPAVKKLLAQFILIKYQADKPDDPLTERLIDHFRILGLPTYVILEPR
jgi:thioredoxin:protein disulfide reductase